MPSVKKALSYVKHYGLKSAIGLAGEKYFVDKKRFSPDKKRSMPEFKKSYTRAKLPALLSTNKAYTPLTVMYLIHYFYPSKKGGTERFTLNLAKEQAKMGNNPIVLVLEANESEGIYTESLGNILFRYYEYDGISCIAFRHKKAPLGLYYKEVNLSDNEMVRFAKYITERHSVDVIHATYPQPFSSFLIACRDMKIPYIITCTDFCMMCHYSTLVDKNGDFCNSTDNGERCSKICKTFGCSDFSGRRQRAIEVLRGAELVTVPSEFVARVIGNEYPEIAFVPVAHGISSAFQFSERKGQPRRFVYAGTLSALKGVHMLIDAFNSCAIPGAKLDIYGEGDESYVGMLKAKATNLVKFHGAVAGDQMPKIYSEADCVIIPSMWYETYNFVLREALMTGALALSADIGAMPEAVDDGENGYLFAPADKESLAQALRKAFKFDFSKYKKRSFPTLREEAEIYFAAYHAAYEKNG